MAVTVYHTIWQNGIWNVCLASPANLIYGRVKAMVLSHVTFMPVLLRPMNNFLGQVIGNASEGEYNTVNNSSSGEVTFQKCLNSGITLFSYKNSNMKGSVALGTRVLECQKAFWHFQIVLQVITRWRL